MDGSSKSSTYPLAPIFNDSRDSNAGYTASRCLVSLSPLFSEDRTALDYLSFPFAALNAFKEGWQRNLGVRQGLLAVLEN